MVPDHGNFVVADGMGGHAAGEVASEMAVRFVARSLGSLKGLLDEQVADRMRTAIRAANGAIFQRTLTEHDKRGMGTTVTALVLFATRFLVGQVGDSRAYLYRDGRLIQLTKDHSYVQEQVDAGYLTPEQARSHPYSNVITRCVGANSDVMPDIYLGTVKPTDLFLLASDGLTGMLEWPTRRRSRSRGGGRGRGRQAAMMGRGTACRAPTRQRTNARSAATRAATSSRDAITRSTIACAGTATSRSTNTRSRRAERYSSAATRGSPKCAAAAAPTRWVTVPSRLTRGSSSASMSALAGKSRNNSPGSR